MIEVDYITYQQQLKIKNDSGKRFIFDPVRKKWLVLQPEELVRQLVVQYLASAKKYPYGRMAIERGFVINERQKRLDLLVYDKEQKPFLLVECKAPSVRLDDRVFEQIAMYNLSFQVSYLMVTNGITTYCCKMDYKQKTFAFIDEIPRMEE